MEILKDTKHWFGWILTTSTVAFVFYLWGTTGVLFTFKYLILLGVIVGIDLIKHKIKWQ